MKIFWSVVILFSFLGLHPPLKAAENIQTATLHDGKELILNGMGKAKQLSDSFYIGALYLEEPYRSVDNINYINNYKRMQLRIVNKRVSARRFAQYWKESISINNPRNIWEPQVKDVLVFTGFFKKTLIKGDVVNFDYVPAMGTYVSINGVFMGRIRNPTFQNLLMMTWLGNRPPNELFKLGVMGGNDSQTAVKLQDEFKNLQPTEKRIAITASWFEDAKDEKTIVAKKKPVTKLASKKKVLPKKSTVKKSTAKKAVNKTKAVKKKVAINKKPAKKNQQTTIKAKVIVPKVAVPKITKVNQTPKKIPIKKVAKKKAEAKPKQPKTLSSSEQLKLYAARNSYERMLRKSIRKFQNYPLRKMLRNRSYKRQMERGQIESTGVLWIKIGRNGSVLSTKLEQSTGINILDKAAIEMVERADPLPKMPAMLGGDDFEFLVQLKYLSPEL